MIRICMLDSERIKYYDTLKLLAIMAVISLHIFQIWWGRPMLKVDLFKGICEIARFGVPLFLMVTGALLLNREIEIKSFFKRKLVRICYPFIFYLIIHLCILMPSDFNVFNYNWYFWMILCVYFTLPIINKFILNSKLDELEYFVIAIIASSIIYQILNVYSIKNYLNLSFFIGPVCYLILGYYLSIKDFKISNNKIVTICIILFFASTILKMMGALNIIPPELTMNYAANRTKIVSSLLDVGILQLIQTSSVFVLVKYIYKCKAGIYSHVKNVLENNSINKFIISVSKASYGMYLVNRTFMLYCDYHIKGIPLTGKQIILCFVMLNIAIFFLSWAVVVILSKIPVLKKFSGYA